jgi:(4-O-methyl)-D-glucuronate---lignin esterase
MTRRTHGAQRARAAFFRLSALATLAALIGCSASDSGAPAEPGAGGLSSGENATNTPPPGGAAEVTPAEPGTSPGEPGDSTERVPDGIMLAETPPSPPVNGGATGAEVPAAPIAETPPAPLPTEPPAPPPTDSPPPALAVENSGLGCSVPQLPGFAQLPVVNALPDPFVSLNGTRITTRAEWTCRRAEISAQVQQYELGPKPARPSVVTGQLQDTRFDITVGEPGNTVAFSVNITRPEGAGPFPAMIEIGGSSLDNSVLSDLGVARINFNNGAMGAQSGGASRGTGTFYDLYGADHGAGSMMAWAWGVSRIIDALEAAPEVGIDVKRLGVTGCSRNGKGALIAGAFDERIALTIPQESGAGGSASWRISRVQNDAALAINPNATPNDGRVQLLADAQGEQPWFRASFNQFNNVETRLPFDHHMVLGLVAPRPLLVIDNSTQIWLGHESSFTDSVAAREIWTALGAPESMGVSQVGDHNHCAFPASQRAELAAFVEKFLVGTGSANTNVVRSDRITPDRARWFPWTTPALE